jgi:hypothetical protein
MIRLRKIIHIALIRKIWQEKCRIRNQKADAEAYLPAEYQLRQLSTQCAVILFPYSFCVYDFLKIQVFCDVTLFRWVFPAVSTDRSAFIFWF